MSACCRGWCFLGCRNVTDAFIVPPSYSLTTAETVRVLLSYLVEVQDSSDTDRAYR